MRRAMLVWLPVLVLLAVAAPSDGFTRSPLIAVKVKPSHGGPRGRFKVSFRAPSEIGRSGIVDRSETVSVGGPAGQGCRSSVALSLPPAQSQSEVRVIISPGARRWCAGRFRGTIIESERVVCGGAGPPHACPDFAIAPETIARFGFTVASRSR